MTSTRGLVIIGDRAFAEIACAYFRAESRYQPRAFAVHRKFRQSEVLMGLPVVAIEDLQNLYPSSSHDAFIAVTYGKLNRIRRALYDEIKGLGYQLAKYVSPRAFVWNEVPMGDNVFIFENNVVQPYVVLGNNVVLWSGNHVGHHSCIEDDCFISSHVVVSGYCTVGRSSFLGVNAAVGDNVKIAPDCWIGPGCIITGDTKPGEIYRAPAPEASKVSALRFFKVS